MQPETLPVVELVDSVMFTITLIRGNLARPSPETPFAGAATRGRVAVHGTQRTGRHRTGDKYKKHKNIRFIILFIFIFNFIFKKTQTIKQTRVQNLLWNSKPVKKNITKNNPSY